MPLRANNLYLQYSLVPWRQYRSFLLALMACLLSVDLASANVRYVGQVTPTPDPNEDNGSSITNENVEVGVDAGGGIFIDFTITLSNPPTFLATPVSSLSANLGVERNGFGRVEIIDNAWFLTNGNPDALIVGDEGLGYLDLFTSALVDLNSDPNDGSDISSGMVIGNQITGQGQVTINTIASRIESNNLVVGNEGLGSILLTDTGSLVSTVSSVGSMFTGQGSVTLNDASRWDLRDRLLVGDAGIGDVVLNGTSNIIAVRTDGPDPNHVIIGSDSTGQGSVTLNESSRFYIESGFVVGDAGYGTVVLNGASTLISGNSTPITGDSTIGRVGGSTGHVTLNETSRWDVRGSLNIAVAAGGDPNTSDGIGTLSINDTANVQVESTASVVVGQRGEINMGGGTLKHLPPPASTSPIDNFGIIRGKGTIDAAIDNNGSGEIRNSADVADQREKLLFTLPVTNAGDGDATYDTSDGLIESQGGEMEFHGLVTNTGAIVIDDAIMRFRASEISGAAEDLVNDGVVFMAPGATLYGDISSSTGNIIVDLSAGLTGGVQVFGDITYVPSIVSAITEVGEPEAATSATAGGLGFVVDDNPSVLTVLGDIVLDNTSSILDFDYVSSVPTDPNDSFVLATASSIVGDFFNSQVEADGYLWDISIVGNDIVVNNTGVLATGILGDFDGNGRVDSADFLAWQRNPSLGDIADWTANYGTPATTNVTTVPEPSTLLMSLAILTMRIRRRD